MGVPRRERREPRGAEAAPSPRGGVDAPSELRGAAAEQELAAYRHIFQHSPEGVLFTAPDGRVLAANPAACEILGMPEGEVCRLGRQGVADPDDPAWEQAVAARARAGSAAARLRFRRGDGSTFPAEVASSVFRDERGRDRACVIFRDVSAEEEAELRVRSIGELTQALLAGTDLGTVLAMTARQARSLAGASVAWVTRLAPDEASVDIVAGDGDKGMGLVGRRFPLANTPTGRALATGGAVFVDELAREAGATGAARRLGLGATLIVPLRSGGRSFGSLVVAADQGHPRFDARTLAVVQLYADAAAVALSLGEARTEAERRPLDVLQRVALPNRLPRVRGASLAARYEPARHAQRVSGDWYDALVDDHDRAVLVIGDVAGSGLGAAALTAQLRNTIRAFLLDGASPAAVLSKVDTFYPAFQDGASPQMATVAVARLDPAQRTLTYALAGHFPPLVADGRRARWLDAPPPIRPLGVVPGGFDHREATATLPTGSTVALVTDGLVERRGEPLDEGMARVRRALAALAGPGRDLEEVADRLMAKLGTGNDDDRCLLLCRLVADPGVPSDRAPSGVR